MSKLSAKTCKVCEGGASPLTQEQVDKLMPQLEGWELNPQCTEIQCTFAFKNYYHTMAFVNAVAYMAHHENHHPDMEVAYNKCVVRYTTHAIGGLSDNDFICAAKVDEIVAMSR